MELQIQFLEALNPKLASCPQIRAGWLGGSFGRGQADRYSDIDLHLLAENVDSFRSGVKEWLEAISPLVLCRLRFEGRMITNHEFAFFFDQRDLSSCSPQWTTLNLG